MDIQTDADLAEACDAGLSLARFFRWCFPREETFAEQFGWAAAEFAARNLRQSAISRAARR